MKANFGVGFVSAAESGRWLACDVPGEVASFIAHPTTLSGLPAAGNGPGGEVRISQMLVLVEEDGRWWITAQHNAMHPAGD